MRYAIRVVAGPMALGLFVVSCTGDPTAMAPSAPTPAAAQPGPAVVGLVAALNAQQARATVVEEMQLAGFSVKPWLLDVNEEHRRVQVLEYPSRAALESDAARVSPDGFRIGAASVDWIATPHFYKSSSLIVVYVGCNRPVMALLEGTVGLQFAGGGSPAIVDSPC
jgi:hypothetical protein